MEAVLADVHFSTCRPSCQGHWQRSFGGMLPEARRGLDGAVAVLTVVNVAEGARQLRLEEAMSDVGEVELEREPEVLVEVGGEGADAGVSERGLAGNGAGFGVGICGGSGGGSGVGEVAGGGGGSADDGEGWEAITGEDGAEVYRGSGRIGLYVGKVLRGGIWGIDPGVADWTGLWRWWAETDRTALAGRSGYREKNLAKAEAVRWMMGD